MDLLILLDGGIDNRSLKIRVNLNQVEKKPQEPANERALMCIPFLVHIIVTNERAAMC